MDEKILKALREHLDKTILPLIKQLCAAEVDDLDARIQHHVRQMFADELRAEIRATVREAVRSNVDVIVTLRGK